MVSAWFIINKTMLFIVVIILYFINDVNFILFLISNVQFGSIVLYDQNCKFKFSKFPLLKVSPLDAWFIFRGIYSIKTTSTSIRYIPDMTRRIFLRKLRLIDIQTRLDSLFPIHQVFGLKQIVKKIMVKVIFEVSRPTKKIQMHFLEEKGLAIAVE